MSSKIPASLRLFDGDFSLTLTELREAEKEIVLALELDRTSAGARALRELLVTAQHLIASKVD